MGHGRQVQQRYQFLLLIVTIVICVLLISPGTSWWVEKPSAMLGGTDETDAGGHVVLFTLLAMGWTWALGHYWVRPRVITVVVAGGVTLAAITELAQLFIPERGSSLIDFGADVLGTLIGVTLALLIVYVTARNHSSPTPPDQP
jgi:hypothetical protein